MVLLLAAVRHMLLMHLEHATLVTERKVIELTHLSSAVGRVENKEPFTREDFRKFSVYILFMRIYIYAYIGNSTVHTLSLKN